MISWITAQAAKVGSGIGTVLVGGIAIVGGILLAIGKLKQAGRDAERSEQAARNEEFRRQANEVRDRVDTSGRAELDDGVRKWTRPD